MTAPSYIPYSEDLLQINELADGTVTIDLREDVSGYEVNEYPSETHNGTNFHLTAWTSTWENTIKQSGSSQSIVLNSKGEEVSAVYYFQTDGSEDRLIYGDNDRENSGVITLPRLYLSHYLMAACIVGALALSMAIFFRGKEKIVRLLMGTFLGIILITLPLFVISAWGLTYYTKNKRKLLGKLE